MREKCAAMGVPVLKTAVREAVAVREAQTLQQSLYLYAERSKPAQDYIKLLEEVIR